MKVTVENHDGRLRLRFKHQGKRYTLGCGVPDTPTGRALAKQRAAQIELDVSAGYFDSTLLKYKPRTIGKTATEISAVELFERYTQEMKRDKSLSPNALQKYRALANHLKAFFKDASAQSVGDRRAGDFTAYLIERMAGQTAKQYLFLLRGCWDWAKGKYCIAPENPWAELPYKVRATPTKRVKPFNEQDAKAILTGFKNHRHFKHYYPFVMFLFHTGARPGEAIGLRWDNVADDFTHAVVCEAVSRGNRRDRTKTGKSRVVNLTPTLSQLLRERYVAYRPKPDELVFPAPKGGAIDDHNFLSRAWKKVLTSVGVEYRKTYAVRHSVISHALANGVNPVALAEQTGHDVRVLLGTYAHVIQSQSVFVEF